MSIVNNIDTIRYQAQTKLVELGVENSLAYEEGKLNEDALETGLSLITLLRALEWNENLTNEEIENLLYCLVEIAEINSFPLAPTLSVIDKPDILVGLPGPKGDTGAAGESGEANINNISDPAFDNITISEEDIAGVRTFKYGYSPYVVSFAVMAVTNGLTREIGSYENVNFTASITNGRESIVTQTITSPITPTWITDPQTFADNALVINSRTTRIYTARVDDGTTVDTDSDNVEFLYPIFHGSSATILTGLQIYANLTKLVATIGNKSVVYSFTDEYAYFCVSGDYNVSSIQILDGSGFDVTSDFQVDSITVDSGTALDAGGGTDWTKTFHVFRTIVKTDIAATYQFLNITE